MATIRVNDKRLRAIMAERGWTERELAAQMDIAYSYINRILSGQRGIGPHALAGFRLARIAWEEVVEIVEDQKGHE